MTMKLHFKIAMYMYTKFEPVNGDRRRVAYEKAVMPMNNKEKMVNIKKL